MDHLADIFSGDAFSALSLSTAINLVPNQYGRVNELGIFSSEGVDTTMVGIEFEKGVLNLIPSTKRGTPAPKNKSGKREIKPFVIPHLPLDDMIYPSDIQNVKAFGANNLKTPESETAKRLESMARKHDITHEYLRCGALNGLIKDADGTTLFNLFTEFGVTEKVVDFQLDQEATDVAAKCREVSGYIEDNLEGDTMIRVHALCSPEFFNALISHKSVKEAYVNFQGIAGAAAAIANQNPLRNDVRKGFQFQDIFFEEYRGKSNFLKKNGGTESRPFIPANDARFFPIGTTETFKQFNAPADWMETVNTIGQPKYAKVVPERGGRYVEVLSESNPLPLCLRPAVLVKGTI